MLVVCPEAYKIACTPGKVFDPMPGSMPGLTYNILFAVVAELTYAKLD